MLGPIDFAAALVRWIQNDPFYPPMGRHVVRGWDERIKTYAYATRANPLAWPAVYADVTPFTSGLSAIVGRYHWPMVGSAAAITKPDLADLHNLAEQICHWGGVPQRRGYASTWAVIKSAILGAPHHGAPINSGWTKVASFATDGHHNSQTIWDSRVSTSLVWRLDQLLNHWGLTTINLLAHYNIGRVPGRAYRPGDPRYRHYHFVWPNGYMRWDCHFAGSRLVRDMVKVLNNPINGYPPMPSPIIGGAASPWNVLGVGLVLFMDGR